jgi:hypothetical protein
MVAGTPQAPTLSSGQLSLLHQMSPQQAHSRSQSDLFQHSSNQMTPAMGSARPVPRTAQSQINSMDAFQITPELIAEIDQAHSLGVGMSGVAYAGGISLGPVARTTRLEPSLLPKVVYLPRNRHPSSHSNRRVHPHCSRFVISFSYLVVMFTVFFIVHAVYDGSRIVTWILVWLYIAKNVVMIIILVGVPKLASTPSAPSYIPHRNSFCSRESNVCSASPRTVLTPCQNPLSSVPVAESARTRVS